MSNELQTEIETLRKLCKQPPPFIELFAMWYNDRTAKNLRMGQWFYNKFLYGSGITGDLKDKIDRLHAERDIRKCQDMIEELYIAYQWPMA